MDWLTVEIKSMFRLGLVFVFSFALTGCVHPPPAEFGSYVAAFEQAREASETVVIAFEPIERTQRAPTDPLTFDPDDAPYIALDGRGGISRLIGEGFESAAAWNTVLTRYAEGESITLIRPRIDAFAASVAVLASTAGLPQFGPGVEAAAEGLVTLAGAALAVADRQAFAEVVRTRSGTVDAFLAELRAQTAGMFDIAVAYANARRSALLRAGRDADSDRIAEDLEAFRQMLAGWVLTLDRARDALGRLEAAVVAGEAAGPTLAAATFWADELAEHAQSVKFTYRSISEAF